MERIDDIALRRKANLAAEVDRLRKIAQSEGVFVKGGNAYAAAKLGCAAAQLDQWLRTDGGKSQRNMSGATARRFEAKLGRPKFWLDQDHNAPEQSELTVADQIEAINAVLNAVVSVLASSRRGKAAELRKVIQGQGTPKRLLKQGPIADLLAILDAAEQKVDHRSRSA